MLSPLQAKQTIIATAFQKQEQKRLAIGSLHSLNWGGVFCVYKMAVQAPQDGKGGSVVKRILFLLTPTHEVIIIITQVKICLQEITTVF